LYALRSKTNNIEGCLIGRKVDEVLEGNKGLQSRKGSSEADLRGGMGDALLSQQFDPSF